MVVRRTACRRRQNETRASAVTKRAQRGVVHWCRGAGPHDVGRIAPSVAWAVRVQCGFSAGSSGSAVGRRGRWGERVGAPPI